MVSPMLKMIIYAIDDLSINRFEGYLHILLVPAGARCERYVHREPAHGQQPPYPDLL